MRLRFEFVTLFFAISITPFLFIAASSNEKEIKKGIVTIFATTKEYGYEIP
ncbi:MAG: hypothetical protein HYZ47_04080 [Simkania negevensis]|nr:hypothetical protein [Simkania negevensis]